MISPNQITIRLLNRNDAADYQRLRLQSLREAPEAFLSDHVKESTFHKDIFANHIEWSTHLPDLGYYGIFVDGKLAGYVQISKTMLEKQEHIVFINNLYIDSTFQHQGLATTLLNHVFEKLRNQQVVERAFVQCTAKNKKACNFYVKNGFRRYSVQRQAIKWQGAYDDAIEFVKVL